jgi:cell division septation protein DedD
LADHYQQEEATGMSLWLKIVIALLSVIILIAIAYLVKPSLFEGNKPVETLQTAAVDSNAVPVDSAQIKQDSIAKTDSILKANQVQKKIATDTVAKKTATKQVETVVAKEPEKTAVSTGEVTYHIIASAYKTEKVAEKYIDLMKKNGYEAKIANMTGPWKKVSIASFKTRKEAEEQLPILQKKLKGKGFYIQQINNNTP